MYNISITQLLIVLNVNYKTAFWYIHLIYYLYYLSVETFINSLFSYRVWMHVMWHKLVNFQLYFNFKCIASTYKIVYSDKKLRFEHCRYVYCIAKKTKEESSLRISLIQTIISCWNNDPLISVVSSGWMVSLSIKNCILFYNI